MTDRQPPEQTPPAAQDVWVGEGDAPTGAVVWRDGSYVLTACYCCPACRSITRLWQWRTRNKLDALADGPVEPGAGEA